MIGSQQLAQVLPMPVIGHPEVYYVKQIQAAEHSGNIHAREGFKVGRYVTLAMDSKITWDEKFRYFRHVLKHHCTAPLGSDVEVQAYYGKLLDLVKRYASQEAMKVLKHAHDQLRSRAQRGEPRETLKSEASMMFTGILGAEPGCPAWMRGDTWEQIKVLQKQWV